MPISYTGGSVTAGTMLLSQGAASFSTHKPIPFIGETRYFRRNEGTTDCYETNARLIPNPKAHFDVEFQLLGSIDAACTFVAQNVSASAASREFQIFQNNNTVRVLLGGSETVFTSTITNAGTYRIVNDGVNIEIFRNGLSIETQAAVIGAATEGSATFTMAGRHAGSLSSYGFTYAGVMSDVVIRNSSGVIINDYPVNDDANTLVDLVGGNNATVINGNPEDWQLYTQQENGDWVSTFDSWGKTNLASDWSGVGVALSDVSGGVSAIASDGSSDRAERTIVGSSIVSGRSYRFTVNAAQGIQGSSQFIQNFTFATISPTPIATQIMSPYTFDLLAMANTGLVRMYAASTGTAGDEVIIGNITAYEVLKLA